MHAQDLAQTAYATSRAPIRTDRGTEYEIFARITHRMKAAANNSASSYKDLVHALYENRQLWSVLAVDVADHDNGLPASLRAQIFYLSEFTVQHTRKVLNDGADIDVLVDINTAIMRGLRHQSGAVA